MTAARGAPEDNKRKTEDNVIKEVNVIMDSKKILELAHEQHDYILGMRRYFHAHPERSLEEYETAKRIRGELDLMGIPWEAVDETGTIGILEGSGASGRTIGLRADIDALDVQEINGTEYDSQVPGVAHACGHDAHASMLLGAAKVFRALGRDNIPGRVLLIFQAAEEMAAGAKLMTASGKLDGVDAIYGQHVWSTSPAGVITTRPGILMAGASTFKITVKGKGGHSSKMHDCKDPILGASAINMALQTVVGQDVPGTDQATLCVGMIYGGTRFNVVPDDCYLEGTIRFMQPEAEDIIKNRMREIVEYTAKAYGMEADIVFPITLPVTINDDEVFAVVEDASKKILGEDGLVIMEPDTGSEDFAFYRDICPTSFAFLGSQNIEKGIVCAHHAGDFRIDEDILDAGAAMYVQVALDYFDKYK